MNVSQSKGYMLMLRKLDRIAAGSLENWAKPLTNEFFQNQANSKSRFWTHQLLSSEPNYSVFQTHSTKRIAQVLSNLAYAESSLQ